MPDAVETVIMRLLIARLDALVLSPAVPGAWQTPNFVPPVGSYLRAALIWNDNINRFAANDSTTELRGIFQVTVLSPLKAGMVVPTNIAGAVAAHFDRQVLSGSGLTVKIEGKPSLAGILTDPPDRQALPVSIDYYTFN